MTTPRYHANGFITTLATNLTASGTSITLTSATGLPSIAANETFRLTLRQNGKVEIIEVTDDASSPTFTCTRAMEGTTGQVFIAGAIVELCDTADSFDRKDDKPSFTTTATAAGTTTLTVASNRHQYFTGTTTQTVKLPVVSTLITAHPFIVVNKSTGIVTVQSSGSNTLQAMAANTVLICTCISTSGTGTSSWEWWYLPIEADITGTGSLVRSASPTFTGTLTAAAIVATSVNVGETDLTVFESGTWTPVLTCASPGTLSVSYGTQSGVYLKINDLVLVRCNLTYTPTFGTASGNVRVTGAPFTINGTVGMNTPILNSSWTWPSSTTTPMCRAISGQVYFELYGSKSGSSLINFAITDGANSTATQWNFTGFYYV